MLARSQGSAAKNPRATWAVNERRNNEQLYRMYPRLHHTVGTHMAKQLWTGLLRVQQPTKAPVKRGLPAHRPVITYEDTLAPDDPIAVSY